jgi:hypothetical protein
MGSRYDNVGNIPSLRTNLPLSVSQRPHIVWNRYAVYRSIISDNAMHEAGLIRAKTINTYENNTDTHSNQTLSSER